ncbi:VWA domain-containing protein [Candidatus Woesearchaeota archaeon]|nr:VWA domain-containing protein [Candidatus Woesearchaeota archaeon]
MKRVMIPNYAEPVVSTSDTVDELSGKLGFQDLDDKFMHSVLENDKSVIEDGKLIENAINQGIGAFTPDLLFEQLVENYSLTEKTLGKTLLRQLFGYDPDYLRKNIKIPEFKRLLRQRLEKTLHHLKQKKLLDDHYFLSNAAYELASLVMYVEEIDHIVPKGIQGERFHNKESHYGGRDDVRQFRSGDRYRDIAVRRTLHTAIRRGHDHVESGDLRAFERKSKGKCYIIYAIDASGSMKGDKIGSCKKAGIALAYKAIQNKDKVGLIVFGDDIKEVVEPTQDFPCLLRSIVHIHASKQTNIAATLRKAAGLFPSSDVTKHVLLLTDALPTTGIEPENETLEAVSLARNKGITVSIIGILLDEKGVRLAEQIAELGGGKLYRLRDIKEMDRIVLEDYYNT